MGDDDGDAAADADAATLCNKIKDADLADVEFIRVKIVRHKTITKTEESKTVRTCRWTGAVIETVVSKETVQKICTVAHVKKSDISE